MSLRPQAGQAAVGQVVAHTGRAVGVGTRGQAELRRIGHGRGSCGWISIDGKEQGGRER